LPEHCVAPGAQTPEQFPLTQAWLLHGVPFCQVPEPSQVWGVWPLHCLAPTVHSPHTPVLQLVAHAEPLCHAPFESHVCGVRPLHRFVPGAHTPVHDPPTHA
jgi:hypothetical protein